MDYIVAGVTPDKIVSLLQTAIFCPTERNNQSLLTTIRKDGKDAAINLLSNG